MIIRNHTTSCRWKSYPLGSIPTSLVTHEIIPSSIYVKLAYHKTEGFNREELFGHIRNVTLLNILHLLKEGRIFRDLKKRSVLPEGRLIPSALDGLFGYALIKESYCNDDTGAPVCGSA